MEIPSPLDYALVREGETTEGEAMNRRGVFLLAACSFAAICLLLVSCKMPSSNTVNLTPGAMIFTGDYVADGGNLSVTLPVENYGSGTAPGSTARFYLASTSTFDPGVDTDLGSAAVSSIPAGSSVSVNPSLTIPDGLDVNEVCYIYAVVDSPGAITETDETDNQSAVDTAAAVLVYDNENASRTYAVVLQTYLGSDPPLTAGAGATDTVIGLYQDITTAADYLASDMSGATDFSIVDRSSSPLGPGTYYVVVESYSGLNGPYALSVRTANISSSDLPLFADLASNAQDAWESDDNPNTGAVTVDKTIPTKPYPVKLGAAANRYSADGDWDWFTFVLP
jgi:hypothetical protein